MIYFVDDWQSTRLGARDERRTTAERMAERGVANTSGGTISAHLTGYQRRKI
jgi:hypothetical protein